MTKKWKRYRFFTNSIDDYRPLIFNAKYPYWCTGIRCGTDTKTWEDVEQACIVAYLPEEEDLKKYWDDAEDIEFEVVDKIIFTSRFPKPDYFIEEKAG